MKMGRRGIISEGKLLFNQRWSNTWEIIGKYKKLLFRYMKSARKFVKQNWDRKTSGGQLYVK